jgi:hypothetical protein
MHMPHRRRRDRMLDAEVRASSRGSPAPRPCPEPRRGGQTPRVLDGSASPGASRVGWIALHPAPVEEGPERARQHGYDRDRIRL